MRGLYLYCLRDRTEMPQPIEVPGIDGENTVRLTPFREVDAVVSEVSVEEFASQEVQRKATEDIDWIKQKSLAHQRVIVQSSQVAGRAVSVVPMRFGTIYTSPDNLEQALADNYAALQGLLEKLRGKREWSVKVYLVDPDALDAAVCQANQSVMENKQEMERLPEGLAFFMEQEFEEAITRQRKAEIRRLCEEVSCSLAAAASDSRHMQLLREELTGRSEPMVFNAACLVADTMLAAFNEAITDQKKALRPKGLTLECTGPLPPFSFSTVGET